MTEKEERHVLPTEDPQSESDKSRIVTIGLHPQGEERVRLPAIRGDPAQHSVDTTYDQVIKLIQGCRDDPPPGTPEHILDPKGIKDKERARLYQIACEVSCEFDRTQGVPGCEANPVSSESTEAQISPLSDAQRGIENRLTGSRRRSTGDRFASPSDSPEVSTSKKSGLKKRQDGKGNLSMQQLGNELEKIVQGILGKQEDIKIVPLSVGKSLLHTTRLPDIAFKLNGKIYFWECKASGPTAKSTSRIFHVNLKLTLTNRKGEPRFEMQDRKDFTAMDAFHLLFLLHVDRSVYGGWKSAGWTLRDMRRLICELWRGSYGYPKGYPPEPPPERFIVDAMWIEFETTREHVVSEEHCPQLIGSEAVQAGQVLTTGSR